MSRKSEAKLWDLVKNLNKNHYFERIESSTVRGIPDVHAVMNGQMFWLELKSNNSKNWGVSKWQINWHVDYQRAGGKSFILVRPLKESHLELLAVCRESRSLVQVARTSSLALTELESMLLNHSGAARCAEKRGSRFSFLVPRAIIS